MSRAVCRLSYGPWLAVFAVLLLGPAACRKKTTAAGDGVAIDQFHPPDVVPGSTVLATLERTGCYGECPVYRLTVNDDGSVVYVGTRWVKVIGRQQFQIGPAQVSELRAAFERAGFIHLRDYDRVESTDDDWALLSFRQGLAVKHVRHYHADNAAPPALGNLEDEFDRIVGSGRFVGMPAIDGSLSPSRGNPSEGAPPPGQPRAATHPDNAGPPDDMVADPDNHP